MTRDWHTRAEFQGSHLHTASSLKKDPVYLMHF